MDFCFVLLHFPNLIRKKQAFHLECASHFYLNGGCFASEVPQDLVAWGAIMGCRSNRE